MRRTARGASRAVRRGLSLASLPGEGGWLQIRIDAGQGERELPSPRRDAPGHLLETLLLLDAAAADPQVHGVLLVLEGPLPGWSAAHSLHRAVAELARRGTPVVSFAEQLDEALLYVASAGSRIVLPETGRVQLLGLRAEGFYFRDLLERLEVEPEVVRIGSHKSAAEMFTRGGMSPEQREQLEALVDDLFEALVEGIAAGRGLPPRAVRDLVDGGPYGAARAREAGLVDRCAYADELDAVLREVPAELGRDVPPGTPQRIDARTYASLRVDAAASESGGTLAYLVAQGSIHRGGGRGIGSEAFVRLFESLRSDPWVRGVVLRIDSPGGDALASDLLWRGVDRLRREKPVVASMAEVAASGGYYLASAADTVFAETGSVTGSIGVIGGKLNLSGLYDKLGVGRDGVERGARAGLLSETRAFTPDERQAVRDEMEELYAAFVDRVARGRGLAVDAVQRVAGGRVWSGARALGAGLVDETGGPLEALRELRRQAGFRPGERPAVQLHPRLPALGGLLALLRRSF
ncbi:MAG: signal peptide peptidase SppA [Myxococcota bacterium]